MSAEQKKPEEEEIGGLDEEETSGDIELTSKGGEKIKISKKFATISQLVKTTLEQDKDALTVPIPGVATDILKKVVEFMEYHKGTEPPIIPKPLRSKEMKSVCSDPWDATFIDKVGESRQQLYDLILAANYMDIKSLLHLGCAKVASLIKGQPLEKIKDILAPQATDKPADKAKEEGKAT